MEVRDTFAAAVHEYGRQLCTRGIQQARAWEAKAATQAEQAFARGIREEWEARLAEYEKAEQ